MNKTPIVQSLFAIGLLAGSTGAAGAQIVRGQVRDVTTHAPLRQVAVALLDARDSVIRSTTTSDSGRFQISVARAGAYSIDLHHIGFNRLETAPFNIGSKDTLNLVFDMSSNGVVLDTVVSRAAESKGWFSVTTGEEFVRQHYVDGKGIVISGWLIERSRKSLSEYLGEQVGLHLTAATVDGLPTIPAAHGEFIVSDSGQHCLYARVDRTSLLYVLMEGMAMNIDEVVNVKDVMAVEVFRTHAELPEEWKADALNSQLYTRENDGHQYLIGYFGFPAIDDVMLDVDSQIFNTRAYSSTADVARTRGAPGETVQIIGGPPLKDSRAKSPSCAFLQIWTNQAWGDRGGHGGGNN